MLSSRTRARLEIEQTSILNLLNPISRHLTQPVGQFRRRGIAMVDVLKGGIDPGRPIALALVRF